MSVSSATVRRPALPATVTRLSASAVAPSSVGTSAPDPTFTSMTSASRPAASFFERIDAVISGIESAVAVTSRIAYRRRSAGASAWVAPPIAQPAERTAVWNRSRSGAVS